MDDLRPAPEGWTWVKTVEDTIGLLQTGEVEALSLDNDLGSDELEGYNVIDWMNENDVWPDLLCIHTNNAVRGRYMRDIISASGKYKRPVPVSFQVGNLIFPALMFTHML